MSPRILDFSAVDGLGFAAAAGTLDAQLRRRRYSASNLGPVFEVLHLAAGDKLPNPVAADWLVLDGVSDLIGALIQGQDCWVSSREKHMGFFRAAHQGSFGNGRWTGFLMDAQRAARDIAQLSGTIPSKLVAAIAELLDNIHEHSNASSTGIVAFQAKDDLFEFVVADQGVGILKSLQSSNEYSALTDHGTALELALTDGVSRFGDSGQRGLGFRSIFVGLANLHGSLRFRSGDHALTIDGLTPNRLMAQLAQKIEIDGFFVSVTCGRTSS